MPVNFPQYEEDPYKNAGGAPVATPPTPASFEDEAAAALTQTSMAKSWHDAQTKSAFMEQLKATRLSRARNRLLQDQAVRDMQNMRGRLQQGRGLVRNQDAIQQRNRIDNARIQGNMMDAVNREAVQRGVGVNDPNSLSERAMRIAVHGGKVQPEDVMNLTPAEFADVMSGSYEATNMLKADDMAAAGAKQRQQAYDNFHRLAGPNVLPYRPDPTDVTSEADLGKGGDAHRMFQQAPTAQPSPWGTQIANDGTVVDNQHPVNEAYGQADRALQKYPPELVYRAMAANNPNPYDFTRELAGQLAATRMRVTGKEDAALDPSTLSAILKTAPNY